MEPATQKACSGKLGARQAGRSKAKAKATAAASEAKSEAKSEAGGEANSEAKQAKASRNERREPHIKSRTWRTISPRLSKNPGQITEV